jgi:ATP:cob(I)alamin adenosyltransferase
MSLTTTHTGNGDCGTTSLLRGLKVSKSHDIIIAIGKLDMLTASLGKIRAEILDGLLLSNNDMMLYWLPMLIGFALIISSTLFHVIACALLAYICLYVHDVLHMDKYQNTVELLEEIIHTLYLLSAYIMSEKYDTGGNFNEQLEYLETKMRNMNGKLPLLRNFIAFTHTTIAAEINIARTVCRDTECYVVALTRTDPNLIINNADSCFQSTITYLNRLSSVLFVLMRHVDKNSKQPEVLLQK